jgi:hypothetical protein
VKPFLTYKSVTLAAYETQSHAVSGSVFVCVSATAAFELSFDGGGPVVIDQGWSVSLAGEGFRFLVFHNTSGAAITITYYAGNAAMAYASQQTIFTVKDPATYVKAGDESIANSQTLTYAGSDGAHIRKQIVVTNLDSNSDLDILDAAGDLCATVFPRSAWTIETSGQVSVENNSGAGISLRVAEIFYV